MIQFEKLGLMAPLLRAVQEQGYEIPTPIQEQAIPPALQRRDLLGCAQTGTGKTAAFALPILQLLAKNRPAEKKVPIRALILTPTRELALQIQENIADYGKYLPMKSAVVFGGVSQQPQTQALTRGIDILTATPGRLLDLMDQGFVKLNSVEIFILDEADRMLDMGFIHDVKRILDTLPDKRQTMLFSATMPEEISSLAENMLDNPVRIEVTPPATTVERITQQVYLTDKAQKRDLLTWLFKIGGVDNALVFTRTKHGADRVARELNKEGITARAIHGDKSQNARQMALSGFKNGECRALVATDIAARGIDIDELSYVVNYDLPNMPDTYVHRIGRTGRAGLAGTALSFCDASEVDYLRDIEKLIRLTLPKAQDNPFPMTIFEAEAPAPRSQRPTRNAYAPARSSVRPPARLAQKPTHGRSDPKPRAKRPK